MSKNFYILKDYFRINGLNGEVLDLADSPGSVGFKGDVYLVSAKNQCVSFQIAIAPENGRLSKFNAVFTPLISETGKEIISGNFSVFAEWFHRLNGKLIPDLLIPMNNDAVSYKIPYDEKYMPDQKAGAVWVDLWIPEDVETGTYTGELKIEADGESETYKIICQVGDFTVPKKNKITLDLNNYTDNISDYFDSLKDNPNRYKDGSFVAVEREFYRLSRDHRCLYHTVPYRHSGAIPYSFIPELEGEGKYIKVSSWEAFDEHYAPLLDGSAFKGSHGGEHPLEVLYLPFNLGWPASYEKWGTKGYRTEYRRILAEFVKHFEEKGWDKTYCEVFLNHKAMYHFFPYTADEIYYEYDEEVMDKYYDIIKDIYDTSSAKFVFRIDSSNHYGNHFDHRFSDMCQLWVAGEAHFGWFPESVEVMHNKGNILWVYGNALTSMEDSLLHMYAVPISTMMWGTDGYTAWNTTGFGDDFLTCPKHGGSEILFYPGSYFGIEAPLPSIRLKTFRNAMQLTELALTLKSTKKQPELMRVINNIFSMKDMSDWFGEKPAFIDTPPYTWDWSSLTEKNFTKRFEKGLSPQTIQKLTQEIYSLITKGADNSDNGVVFRYY